MKRVTFALVWLACAAAACTCQAEQASKRYPPRVKRGSYAEYIVIRQKERPVRTRQVYSGYSSNFPPPAFLYYGYPHSGDGSGIGPLGRQ